MDTATQEIVVGVRMEENIGLHDDNTQKLMEKPPKNITRYSVSRLVEVFR